MEKIINITKEVDAVYALVNGFISEGKLPIMNLVYPNRDGKQDAEAVANLIMLQDSLNRLTQACEIAMSNINTSL